MSEQAFPGLSVAEDAFKQFIWNPGIQAGETALFAYAPFLAAPVVDDISRGIISKVSDAIFDQFRKFVDVSAIRLVDSVQQAAYTNAAIRLKVVANDKGQNSPEYLQALADERASFASSIRFHS